VLGKDQRRHPYNLGEHSNSNRNFEIHNFANIIIPGKFGMLQNHDLEIEASLGTLELPNDILMYIYYMGF
jgi:hypothetical protein